MKTSEYDYEFPPELIAQHPAANREDSRLMRLRRDTGKISHNVFSDFPDLLDADDVIVLNNTKVIPAMFGCRRETGGKIEGIFLDIAPEGNWKVMLKNAGRCRTGEMLYFHNSSTEGVVLAESREEGIWLVRPEPSGPPLSILQKYGRTPLPPYIKRPNGDQKRDSDRYQTVYAETPGSVAAPTAGLHFTTEILDRIKKKGIQITTVTLHVGYGTFAPVKTENPSEHEMHSEWYEISSDTAATITKAGEEGKRIIAVGTSSMRTLESVAMQNGGGIPACKGTTDMFIYPPRKFMVTGAMLTNFHLPRSTLLMLVAAFCSPGKTNGINIIRNAYRVAIENRYRFFSYGDAMFVE